MDAVSPAPVRAPAHWLASRAHRTMVGRLVAAIILGAGLALSIAGDQKADREQGRTLTREQYEKDFESHRDELLHSDDNTPPALLGVAIVLVVVVFVALFEFTAWLLGFGVGYLDDLLQRRAGHLRSRILDDTDE
jgi:hypothetical protein